MRASEILLEYRVEKIEITPGGTEFPVLVNPPADILKGLLYHAKEKRVRAYYDDDGKFYFWDSFMGTHAGVAKHLGLEYNYDHRLNLGITGDDDITLVTMDLYKLAIRVFPYIQRTFDVVNKGHDYLILK